MRGFQLAELQQPLGARLMGANRHCCGISTDSRSIARGELFVALTGPHFDGHAFLPQAAERGACGAVVERAVPGTLPQLLVKESLGALGALATRHRAHSAARVVAITGSNGKTTVKELTASILAEEGPTLATQGNLNNEIGLPLTLLRLEQEAFAVVEMGANHPGEIERLSRIAQPDVALLNNAGRAHLEGFGTVEGVARAKGEIVRGLGPSGTLICNADDPWYDYWRSLDGPCRRVGFGLAADADVRGATLPGGALKITTPDWTITVELALEGAHNRMNALAAAAAAWVVGVDPSKIQRGLERVEPISGRLEAKPGLNGSRLIDDSYNANPDSVGAAIDVLAQQPGHRTLILGELAELGLHAEKCYRELGDRARLAGIDALWAVEPAGEAARAFGQGATRFSDIEALLEYAAARLEADHLMLIKGSRCAGMERVVKQLGKAKGG